MSLVFFTDGLTEVVVEGLGSTVHGETSKGLDRGDTGEVDDSTLLFLSVFNLTDQVSGEQDLGGDVHGDHIQKLSGGLGFEGGIVEVHTDVVDQNADVQMLDLFEGFFDDSRS